MESTRTTTPPAPETITMFHIEHPDDTHTDLIITSQTPDGQYYQATYRMGPRIASALKAAANREITGPSQPDTCTTFQPDATPWRPAHYCEHAVYTLQPNRQLHWVLRSHGEQIDSRHGYPLGAPPVDATAAIAWATELVGPRQWIEKPAGSGAYHTHL